ncbi:hypothetical protein T484DRAFT_3627229, partial [Baffinella frigidus]
QPSTLNPQPSTLYPPPSTLNPQPSTLHPQPSTLNPLPSTLHPQPSTYTCPYTIHHKPYTPNPKPQIVEVPTIKEIIKYVDREKIVEVPPPHTLHPENRRSSPLATLDVQSIIGGNWSRAYRGSVGDVTNSRTNLGVRLESTCKKRYWRTIKDIIKYVDREKIVEVPIDPTP